MVSHSNARKTQEAARTAGILTRDLVVGLLLCVIFASLFAFLWDQVKDKNQDATRFDRAILFWMHTHAAPWATTAATGLAFIGSPPVMIVLAALGLVIGLIWRQLRGAAWTLPLAIIGAGILIQIIKMIFHRPRPAFFTPLLHETGYSFPSGHSLIAVVVYGLFGYFVLGLFRNRAARAAVVVVTVLLVLLIGISRVYALVHYPTDVLAGWTAGVPWLVTCIALYEILARRYRQAGEPVIHDSSGTLNKAAEVEKPPEPR